MIKKKPNKGVEATISFDVKTAIKMTSKAYYEVMAEEMLNLDFRDREKARLNTSKKTRGN